jgi:hypothetical protein
MQDERKWRVFHADGPPPDPDVTALLDNNAGIWRRIEADLWCCPGGTTFLKWVEMSPAYGPYVECPDYRVVIEEDEQARERT